MKKKIIAITAVVMILAITVTGALAYLTDTDTETNTFTVGNVKIDLLECQLHRTNAGKGFTQEPELEYIAPDWSNFCLWTANIEPLGTPENTPNYGTSGETTTISYFSDAQIEAAAEAYKNDDGYFTLHSQKLVPGSQMRKCPYIKNTGANPAYVRLRAYIPYVVGYIYTQTAINENQIARTIINDNYMKDGVRYEVVEYTYLKPVAPGEITFWNAIGCVLITTDMDANALAALVGEDGAFDIVFEADAIQSQGFATAEAAFTAFDAEP